MFIFRVTPQLSPGKVSPKDFPGSILEFALEKGPKHGKIRLESAIRKRWRVKRCRQSTAVAIDGRMSNRYLREPARHGPEITSPLFEGIPIVSFRFPCLQTTKNYC